ncbi:MAG: hypothetical protein LBH96_01590 [Candidatus Peribacteria bacterium]|nr:hypothetical protein [Candidatus Peribacteria bacterium]
MREPIPALKAIQKTIKERLMQIPISLDASSGPKKSAEKNADLHRNNPYLITIDLKNAFPSVNTNRVYTNFKGALRHALDIWTPLLQDENNEITKENKKLFLRALTHLCVSENEIPQGAPTSPQIQHIVMSKTDSEIAKTLPEFLGHYRGVYSRYVDDLAVSFKQYPTKDVLEEKFTTYAQNIEHFKSDPTTLTQILQQFENDTFIATDKFERTFITQKVEELKKLINSAQISSEKKYQYIGQLNAYKQKISP